MDLADEIYRGGFYSLVKGFEKAQTPFRDPLAYLPPAACDLDALEAEHVSPPDRAIESFRNGSIERKDLEFKAVFQGQSKLLYVHAMLIANLRRRSPPPEISVLFQRLWAEKGRWLGQNLSIRWRISAATTFGDHGVTPDQRSLGMGLSILFDMMKLYESERRALGQDPTQEIVRADRAHGIALAFDMDPYGLRKGDLDRNMLARLWSLAEREKIMFPLARSMLFELLTEQRTVFARLQRYKYDVEAQSQDGPP